MIVLSDSKIKVFRVEGSNNDVAWMLWCDDISPGLAQTLVFIMDPQVLSMVKYSSLISLRFNTPCAVFVEWKLSA